MKLKTMNKALFLGMLGAFLVGFSILSGMARADVVDWNNTNTMSNFSFGKEYRGIMIATNSSFFLTNISAQAGSPAYQFCYLYNSTKALLVNASWVNRNCSINYALDTNSGYYIMVQGQYNGASNDLHQYWTATFPYYGLHFSVVAGAINTGGVWTNQTAPTQGFNIKMVYYTGLDGTLTNLYINGTEANASTTYGNVSNLTATVNSTGAWVAILNNNTLVANATNRSTTNITLGAGMNNITAYYAGNTSLAASSATWWVNVSKALGISYTYNDTNNSVCFGIPNNITCTGTNPPNPTLYKNGLNVSGTDNNTLVYNTIGVYNYICNASTSANYTASSSNFSQLVVNLCQNQTLPNQVQFVIGHDTEPSNSTCINSNTLLKEWAYFYNNSLQAYNKTEFCNYGCDNVTMSCNPPAYQQSIWIIAIFIGVLILGLILIKMIS